MTSSTQARTPAAARTTGAGLAVGAAAAVAAVTAHLLVVAVTGREYAQLSVIAITVATLVAVLAGAWIYRLLLTRVRRPAAVFAVIAAAAAVVDTVVAAGAGQGGGFVLEAGVLHAVVAVVAALGLPRAVVAR